MLAGRDVIGIAQTGTGKTASFVLPMLHILANGRARARMPRSLILSPTRELATQTASNFEIYGKYLNLTMALLIGGVGMGDQEKALEKGVDVLIATPGRLLDWFDRGKVLLGGVNVVVLDEADRMLDMGFMPDVERILSLLTGRRQTLLFSATMPPGVRRIIERFLRDPATIEVAPPGDHGRRGRRGPGAGARRRAEAAGAGAADRAAVGHKAIVFANRKREVSSLNRFLQGVGPERARHPRRPRAGAPAGDARRVQGRRGRLPGRDRRGGARPRHLRHAGRDQFRRAFNTEGYVHRIGRTGRAGKSGRAFTLATVEEGKAVAAIERLIGKPIRRLELPGAEAERRGPTRRRRGAPRPRAPATPRSRGREAAAAAAAAGGAGGRSSSRSAEAGRARRPPAPPRRPSAPPRCAPPPRRAPAARGAAGQARAARGAGGRLRRAHAALPAPPGAGRRHPPRRRAG